MRAACLSLREALKSRQPTTAVALTIRSKVLLISRSVPYGLLYAVSPDCCAFLLGMYDLRLFTIAALDDAERRGEVTNARGIVPVFHRYQRDPVTHNTESKYSNLVAKACGRKRRRWKPRAYEPNWYPNIHYLTKPVGEESLVEDVTVSVVGAVLITTVIVVALPAGAAGGAAAAGGVGSGAGGVAGGATAVGTVGLPVGGAAASGSSAGAAFAPAAAAGVAGAAALPICPED